MSTKNPLVSIDFGKLSKPVNTCVERFSDAVGGLFKPIQVVRMAKAEAKAAIIMANAEAEAAKITARANVEVSEIEERGLQRMIREQGRHQENMEDVVLKAIPLLKEDVNSDEFDDDWLTNFFEKCRIISDDEMQTLWAKILAGQANSPGSFSKKTVEIVASLDKADAHTFTNVCRFIWHVDGEDKLVLLQDAAVKLEGTTNLFGTLTHLDELGLLSFIPEILGGGYTATELSEIREIFYFGRPINFEISPGEKLNSIFLGRALLSRAGLELAPICGAEPSNEYYEIALNGWLKRNYTLSCPIDSKKAHSSW